MEPERPERPLLALVMIVKDEARSIEKVIQSTVGAVDAGYIHDTGSTDKTCELADREFEKVRPRVWSRATFSKWLIAEHQTFTNFAETRNRSLENARKATNAIFALILSGDEYLQHPEALRAFCLKEKDNPNPKGAYYIQIEYGGYRFDSARLVRLDDTGWRFVGKVHEVLCKDGENADPRIPGCSIRHEDSNEKRKRSRLYRDLEIIRDEMAAEPGRIEPRSWFYLGQTLEDLGLRAQAIEAYRRRVALGGWKEERYAAAFRIAFNSHLLGTPWREVQALYLDAYSIDPRRAEPFYMIAMHAENLRIAWLFGALAAKIPYPEDCRIFIQPDLYETKIASLAVECAMMLLQADEKLRPDEIDFVRSLLPKSSALKEKALGLIGDGDVRW